MKYILIILLLPAICFGQSPELYKLVYDSMELTTGGPAITKSTSLRKDQDYKVILLEVPKGHNGYDVVISFKEKVVVNPTPVMIDNVPNFVINGQLVNTYSPGAWTQANVAGHLDNTIAYSNVANSSLVTKFTGTKIEWVGERKFTHGIAAVSIDGGPEVTKDLYSPTEMKQQVLFESGILTRGLHTIKIRVTGTKTGASTGAFIVHDAFRVTP